MVPMIRPPRWLRGLQPGARYRLPGGKAQLALTFDDGPDPEYTPRILEVLEKYTVPATFFMTGSAAEQEPDLVRQAARAGHGIGNHYYRHRMEIPFGSGRAVANALKGAEILTAITGASPGLVRPPFGRISGRTRRALEAQGMQVVLWDVMPYDFRQPGARVIADRAARYVRSGSIIVLHDGGGDRNQTVRALSRILDTLTPDHQWVRLEE